VEGELELTGDGLYTLPRHMRRRIRAYHMRRRILPVTRGGGYMPATLPCHMRRRIRACHMRRRILPVIRGGGYMPATLPAAPAPPPPSACA